MNHLQWELQFDHLVLETDKGKKENFPGNIEGSGSCHV